MLKNVSGGGGIEHCAAAAVLLGSSSQHDARSSQTALTLGLGRVVEVRQPDGSTLAVVPRPIVRPLSAPHVDPEWVAEILEESDEEDIEPTPPVDSSRNCRGCRDEASPGPLTRRITFATGSKPTARTVSFATSTVVRRSPTRGRRHQGLAAISSSRTQARTRRDPRKLRHGCSDSAALCSAGW